MRTLSHTLRNRALAPAVAICSILVAFGTPANAQRAERTGKDVVEAACTECHTSGKDGAPRIGDSRAWAGRASQGLTALTAHALTGIRKMPAHGGTTGVSDLEIQRAITYMVNRSGGSWVEPIDPAASPLAVRTSESIVQQQCASCHTEGKDGAPKIGDRAAWTPHMAKGLDVLVASAIHGHGPMPARGGMPDLSQNEIRGAVLYMFNYGFTPPPPAPAPVAADPYHKLVSGTDVYFGVMARGRGAYHLNIALADNKAQTPLREATVKMSVSDGMSVETKTLQPIVANNAVSWGEMFKFASGGAYNITAEIQRPGVPGTIHAKFEFRAP